MGLPWGCSHPSLTGHARGLLTSLVTLHLLFLGSAQLRVEGPGQPVTATVGQDVVLPCHLSPRKDARSLEVRWIRDSISETVHHYRNGEDLYGEQMGAYAGRTELSRDGLSAGSLDLRITGLRPSDDGQYFCTVKNADAYNEATVTLEVSATGADPHLSLGGYEAGGVRVLCRSASWYPLPQLLWRDAHGQHLPSVSQTHSQDQEGLFEIKGAIIVTGSMEGPLSCVVRNNHLQQERESSLHISAPFFHNAQPWKVALALVLVLLAVSIGLGVYLFRKQAAQSRELGESLQSLGKWCLCGRAWSGWSLGACVLVARGCWRSSWSLGWEWGVLPWARDTAGMAERNGDQGGDGERAVGLPHSTLTLPRQGHPPPIPIHFHLHFGSTVQRAAQVSVLTAPRAQVLLKAGSCSLLVWSLPV
uniref:Ig-like domain-containing protein n=1 Tax=Anas platyrhynchos platyrhynchos TaxID=8840 RepID=A0A493TF28_ANAPP